MLDPGKPGQAAADARLRAEAIIWLTTVDESGRPQSSPVWFLWDGAEFLIYGSKDGKKTRNIQANSTVGLHLDGDGEGGGIVIFEGTARVDESAPPAAAVADFAAKYGERIKSYGWTLDALARDYPHVIRVVPTRARIW
jgi:PPOX class probable F420-dependent enzyme